MLGYLRAVRDEQAFKPAAGLTQEAVAAFAAEAQFYGLQELHHRLLHHQFSTPFKYMFVVVNNAWDGPRCYSNVQDPQRARWGFHEPVNLDTLQAEGWEYVCSHAPAGSTSGLAFIIVLRQQV